MISRCGLVAVTIVFVITISPALGLSPICFCTLEYDPVCCRRLGKIETASNPCFCTGCGSFAIILYKGPCHPITYPPPYTGTLPPITLPPPTSSRPTLTIGTVIVTRPPRTLPPFTATRPPIKDCICTHLYDPVCCQTRFGVSIASNSCHCGCRGGRVVDDSKCDLNPAMRGLGNKEKSLQSGQRAVTTPGFCPCPLIWWPVCCATGSGYTTSPNECFCTRCLHGRKLSNGSCPPDEETCIKNCPINIQGACCHLDGANVEVASKCVCECKKGKFVNEGSCSSPY